MVQAIVSPAVAQTPDESVFLAFACQVERGRVALTPAPERAYKIIGPRASHAFTACLPGQPNRCRTWQLHKFDVGCGGTRVSWLAVVAAGLERTPGRGRVEAGRLSLRLGPAWRGSGVLHPMLAFPPGYAPAIGMGARFTGASSPPPTVVEARPDNRPAIPQKQSKSTDSVTAARSEAQAPADQSSAMIAAGWQTTIEAAEVSPWRLNLWRALGGLGLVFATWGLLMFARGRSGTAAPLPPSDDDAALCSELIARAVKLHRASKEALAAVTTDSLRQILMDDLAAVQRALLAPSLTNDVAESRWHAAKPVVVKALADLERIARIISGVLSSAPARVAQSAPDLPQTAAEAFEVLGINPEASRTVIKKVVDGLRQSWHPDHARNDNDRAAREERLKQINVAWDLIRRDRAGEQTAA
jgi:hypothetical protein